MLENLKGRKLLLLASGIMLEKDRLLTQGLACEKIIKFHLQLETVWMENVQEEVLKMSVVFDILSLKDQGGLKVTISLEIVTV